MSAVMLSLEPEIVQKIIEGRATAIVKKFIPKDAMPFKCYVYCRHGKLLHFPKYRGEGRVVGELVCEYINKFKVPIPDLVYERHSEIDKILAKANINAIFPGTYYVLYIKDFILYDTPKELKVFKKASKVNPTKLKHFKTLKRPPLSWCYVDKNLEK